ncbi:MAG TPA: 2-C-methyl-D-erythritol 4-phosphate cytidylyltransferase, partial [Casimicrobiaceae bacterium]
MRTWIVVPAAGGGARFGAAHPKQYADLAGAPVLARTLERLATIGADGIVVALAPDDSHYDAAIGERTRVD